jgi:AraC family transcriptional regulator
MHGVSQTVQAKMHNCLGVLEDDLVVAQITKSILPFLGRSDGLSVLALDQFSRILGAHLIQQYGVLQKTARRSFQ